MTSRFYLRHRVNSITHAIKTKFWFLLFVVIVVGSSMGCSSTKSLLSVVGMGSHNSIKTITVESDLNSNMDTPVAIDIVFINDDSITPLLAGLNGPTWFADKHALLKRYEKQINIVSLEVVPLSFIQKLALPKDKKKAKSVLMFANYRSTNGQFIANISQYKKLKIHLLFDSYKLREMSQ